MNVIHKPITPISIPQAHDDGMNPSTTVLPAGYRKGDGCRPLQVDTIWERDISIPLRDGTKLRADIFRPQLTTGKIPILLVWGPYGKTGTGGLRLLFWAHAFVH